MSGIYCIANLVSGRIYIGSSTNMRKRWQHHLSRLHKKKHINRFLQADFDKCGTNSLWFCVLSYCPKEQLVIQEQCWLDRYYDKQKNCYNMRPVAETNKGKKHSPTTIEKMKMAHKGRKPSPQTIEGSKKYHTGRKLTEQHRQAMRDGWERRKSNLSPEELDKYRHMRGEIARAVWQDPLIKQHLTACLSKPRPYRCKAILQYDLNGNFIAEYPSLAVASNETGININLIRKVLLKLEGRKQTHGFVFKYKGKT